MTVLAEMPPVRRIALPGGGWLNVHEQLGRGPTILLLHGFTDCAQSYRLLLPFLAGRHLVIPDLRGHGRSFRAPIATFADFCTDLESMAAAMHLGEIILVGHSMSALLALQLSARGKLKVDGLVAISGSLAPDSPALHEVAAQFAALPDPLPVDHPFLDTWYACCCPVPEAFLAALRASCAVMRPEDWGACLKLLAEADLRAAAGRIDVTCLLIGGAADPLFPEAHQAALAEALPTAKRIALADVGHNPHWEVPEAVATALHDLMIEADHAEPHATR